MAEGQDPPKKREEIRVVDRRLFNAEGELREPGRVDEPPPVPGPASSPDSNLDARLNPPAPAQGARPDKSQRPRPQGRGDDRLASAHFRNLVMNLATTAAANLGEMPNPFTQRTEIDLEGARQVIDLLQALQSKTQGNLTGEEERLLDSLLYDLQMKFVALQTRAAKPS